MADPVWFWQRMVTPHMAGLAAALAATGREVVYVAERELSSERAAQGWTAPDLGRAQLRIASSRQAIRDLVNLASPQADHICQGFRANGMVGVAQRHLKHLGRKHWIVMETVDDSGWRGALKRLEYCRQIILWQSHLKGVLAIGHNTAEWLSKRGLRPSMAFPFAYFLTSTDFDIEYPSGTPFRMLFVGRLIGLKRVDLLLATVAALLEVRELEVEIVGSGPEQDRLRELADRVLPDRVHWKGQKPIAEVPSLMSRADCLVLPSRYDGWGAVVSEALMVGTPVICSDACGAAGVVLASGTGGVFPADDEAALKAVLTEVLQRGRQTQERRTRLSAWSRCLDARSGANYLDAIITSVARQSARPSPPWESAILGSAQ